MQLFIDLENMANGLMHKTRNHMFNKSGGGNHLLPEQLIQILVLQHLLPQKERLQEYGDQKRLETLSTFVVFFHLKLSDVTFVACFMTILQFVFHDCSLDFSEQKQKQSCFEPFQFR